MNRPARRDGIPERKKSRRRQTSSQPSRQGKRTARTTPAYRAGRRPQQHQIVSPDNPVTAAVEPQAYPSAVRLQKYLAQAGVASRRGSEELIAQGRVEVDGEIVTQQGTKVNPATAVVRVDGERVIAQEQHVYLLLNKPRGYLSTMSDDLGRPCVGDIITERVRNSHGLFHVGRLDSDTEGLLLLTNDGELAHRLMHPSYEVPKTYLATVTGVVEQKAARQLRRGVELDDGFMAADEVQIIDTMDGKSLLKIVVHEGRTRVVRRLCAAVGHPVINLVRTRIADVTLGNQRTRSIRKLTTQEVSSLYEAVNL